MKKGKKPTNKKPIGNPKTELSNATSDNELSMAEEFKLLQKKLYEVRLKEKALETMIDIAEATFNINIRKKSDSKQSKK